jgi:uncharacterized protein YegL
MRLPALLALVAVPTLVAAAACSSPTETSGFTTKDGGGEIPDSGYIIPPSEDGGGGTQDGGFEACATGKTGTRKLPGYIELVLDGSGSMDGDKWTALVTAVKQVVAKWKADADPSFGVGVSVFSDSNDPTSGSGAYPTSADVKIRPADASQVSKVNTRMSGSALGGTPSKKALTGNYTYVDGFNPATAGLPTGGKKIIVFMSDGDPSDDTVGSNGSSSSATLARTYLAKGVTTYSILFADEYTDDSLRSFMGGIAQNGGGLANPGCSATATNATKYCHFEVDTTLGTSSIAQKFYDAVQKARNSIDPCTLAIEKQAGQDFDPTLVTDGNGNKTTVPQDAANGWTFDDAANPQNVIVHGTTCDTVKSDQKASVELILGCPTISR